MNSKDKNGKPPVSKKVIPLMTPRNLVSATPMRFSGTGTTEQATTITTTSLPGRIIKGPQKSGKDKSTVPLPPGYVDRAAQRRSGLETSSNLNIFETEKMEVSTVKSSSDPMKNKLEFLEETSGIEGFPTCSRIETKRLMKLIMGLSDEEFNARGVNDFKDNEAFLQFKSIEESKIQQFDPFNLPRKVFRASSGLKEKNIELEDDFVLERVKEAVKRLEIASERHEKYLETLNNQRKEKEKVFIDDIFPEVGIFDEKATLENVINNNIEVTISGKLKAKNKLFSSKTKPKIVEKEVDIFELIAKKSLDEEDKKSFEEENSGGLFGFSNILPKLSRLESENNSNLTGNKLIGAYASILSDNENDNDEGGGDEKERIKNKTTNTENDDDDDYLYPGYLENDPTIFDSDEEVIDNDKVPKNKRKLARKEDKETAKIEKLVKSKFGVDLSK